MWWRWQVSLDPLLSQGEKIALTKSSGTTRKKTCVQVRWWEPEPISLRRGLPEHETRSNWCIWAPPIWMPVQEHSSLPCALSWWGKGIMVRPSLSRLLTDKPFARESWWEVFQWKMERILVGRMSFSCQPLWKVTQAPSRESTPPQKIKDNACTLVGTAGYRKMIVMTFSFLWRNTAQEKYFWYWIYYINIP